MKKILVLTILLTLVIGGAFAASVSSGALNVFGKIGSGDLQFDVTQTLLATNRIDLIANANVQSDGAGVEVGNWVFDATNQENPVNYSVTYTFGPLTQGTDNIPYELIIVDGTPVASPVGLASGDTTLFSATAGNFNTTRDVLVRLTAAGETAASTAAASSSYNSTVTVDLATI